MCVVYNLAWLAACAPPGASRAACRPRMAMPQDPAVAELSGAPHGVGGLFQLTAALSRLESANSSTQKLIDDFPYEDMFIYNLICNFP